MTRQSTCRPLAIVICIALYVVSSSVGVLGQARGSRSSPKARSTTAEELLEALRKRRPANEVILPQSASQLGNIVSKLLPEGSAMVDRAGAITADDPWWMFTPADGGKPIRLLPNLTLETMVRMAEASETPLLFAVSGELMVFDGANYLLVRSAPRAKTSIQEKKAVPKLMGNDGDNPDPMPAAPRYGRADPPSRPSPPPAGPAGGRAAARPRTLLRRARARGQGPPRAGDRPGATRSDRNVWTAAESGKAQLRVQPRRPERWSRRPPPPAS